MAELTSIISVSGTVGSKQISFSHTYTLESVVDAGGWYGANPNAGTAQTGQHGNADQLNFLPPTFSYAFISNESTNHAAVVVLQDIDSSIDTDLFLMPGQFAVLCTIATGMFQSDGVGTTVAMLECDDIGFVTGASNNLFTPKGSIFIANTAAS